MRPLRWLLAVLRASFAPAESRQDGEVRGPWRPASTNFRWMGDSHHS